MNIEQKERLEQLKKINKEKQRKKEIENNVLLLECKEALGDDGKILEQEEKDAVYRVFMEKVPFLPWGIDWEQFNVFQKINEIDELYEKCESKEFYIIWSDRFPIIKSDIDTIVKNIDDICAVSPEDTWLFSTNYDEVIEFHHEGKITLGHSECKAMSQNEIKYELPVVSFKKSPIIELTGTDMEIKIIGFDEERRFRKIVIKFNFVIANKYTLYCFTPKLYGSYHRLIELVDSEWMDELKDVNEEMFRDYELKHYAIYLNGKGLYQVIAQDCEVIELPQRRTLESMDI